MIPPPLPPTEGRGASGRKHPSRDIVLVHASRRKEPLYKNLHTFRYNRNLVGRTLQSEQKSKGTNTFLQQGARPRGLPSASQDPKRNFKTRKKIGYSSIIFRCPRLCTTYIYMYVYDQHPARDGKEMKKPMWQYRRYDKKYWYMCTVPPDGLSTFVCCFSFPCRPGGGPRPRLTVHDHPNLDIIAGAQRSLTPCGALAK